MARAGGKDRGLYEKQPGEWWIQYNDETGRKRREKGGTKSQARELYAFRKAGVHRRRKGFEPEARKRRPVPTLREAWESYREERDASLRRPDHDRLYQRYWTDLYGHLRLDELKADELHRWRSRRIKQVKASTVNRSLTYLQAIYSLAIRDELVEVNPVSRVGKLDEEKRNRVLSEEEEGRLRQALPWPRFRAIELAIHTGLRRAELFGGRRCEIDLRNDAWRIPQTKDGPERWVPLNERSHAILEEMLAEHSSQWLFPAPIRKAADNRETHHDPAAWTRRHFEDPCRRLGILDINWHDLRHTCATRMLERGVPLAFVQEILGHRSSKTTERYKHLAAQHLRAALQLLVSTPNGHQNGHQSTMLAEDARQHGYSLSDG